MRLQDDIDFTTLNWVKQELDETLKLARQALESYVDDPADASLMRFCVIYLHQVQGTLRMVELYGAAMVVEEMERLAQSILDGEIKQKEEAYSVLMRGIVQLPDYLERLQSGHKDIPIVLLPLLNDLRACRGEDLFSESVLFSPDLSAPLPAEANGAAQALTDAEIRAQAARLRIGYQVALLKWLRSQDALGDARLLQEALVRVQQISYAEDTRRLWWVAAGLLEAVQAGGVDASPAVKLLFGKIDREIKRLVDNGEAAFRAAPLRDLLKNLLYYIAHSTTDGPRVAEIRRTYALESLLPSQKELDHAKGSISGHNRALLDTVSVAIKDDLLRVKEALDIFLRAQGNDPGELSAQVEVLDRVGDTLGMLGLGVPRRVVLEQRQIVEDIVARVRAADESILLDVAGALLYVEASLDDHIDRLGADTPEVDAAQGMELPKAEVRKILDALMKEAATNLAQAKQDIVAFVESPWDHAKIEQIPRLLEEVAGALRMLDLPRPAELIQGVIRFIEVELLRWRRVPTAEQMDKLADAVASIEYYLEAAREQRAGREKILDVTRKSLETLDYWPVPEDDGRFPGPPLTPSLSPTSQASTSATAQSVEVVSDTSASLTQSAAAVLPESPSVAESATSKSGESLSELKPFSLDLDLPEPVVGEFPAFMTDTLPESGAAALHPDANIPDGDASAFPSIPLLADENLDSYLSKLGLSEPVEPVDGPTPVVEQEPSAELREVVQIAHGDGLDALIVGDTHHHTAPPAQDLAGLRFATTESPMSVAAGEPQVRYVEIEEEIEEEIVEQEEPPALAGVSFQSVGSDEIDEEIREVFVEEVQEEIDNLRRYLPLWLRDVSNLENLKSLRRSFHTLKGSGRLVGALALGEFSWKVENMLNRVLDKTIGPTPAVQALIEHALAALPGLLDALKGEGSPGADISGIMDVADRLAVGEDAWLPPAQKPRTKLVKRLVKRLIAVPIEPETTIPELPAADLTETFDITTPFVASETEQAAAAGGAADMPGIGPLPNIDPVLFDILRSEVTQHLSIVDAYLIACDPLPQPVTDTLLRAVHTLHGAIAMVDIPVIGHVLSPLEGLIKRLRARENVPDGAHLGALRESSELVRCVMIELDRPAPRLPDSSVLAERVIALRDALPEPELAHMLYTPDDDGDMLADANVAHLNEITLASPPTVNADESVDLVDSVVDDVESGREDEPVFETEEIAFDDLPEPESVAGAESDLDASFLLLAEPPPLTADGTILTRLEEGLRVAAADEMFDAMDQARIGQALEVESGADLLGLSDQVSLAADTPTESEIPNAAAEVVAFGTELDVGEVSVVQPLPENEQTAFESTALEDRLVFGEQDAPDLAELPDVESLPRLESIPVLQPNDLVASGAEFVSGPSVASPPPDLFLPIRDDAQPDGKLDLPDMDEDLLEIFVQESTDILDHSDTLIARLREAPHERELITGLQRDLHTLKGGARMAGLAPIGDLSHAMESLLEAISEARRVMDRGTVESFERGFDRLHALVQRVARRQAIAMPEHAIARFEDLVSGNLREPAGFATPPVSAPPAANSAVSAVVAPVVRPLTALAEDDTAHAPQEMIRVRSDLLDSLVNYAGEVSIYRSRLEQQVSTFRFNLVEFEQTVGRLRDQLRKLEIETEAQIIARYQREHHEPGQHAFDPLELDRFSQLQQLSRALAESVSDLMSIQSLLDDLTRQSETLLLQQSRVSSDLQEGLMRTRMVPFDSLVPSLRRTLRQAAQEVGKRAQLKVEGAQGEMDRNLLERMKAPFEHMLRNALAHGVELPEERAAAGKPVEGTVTIHVSREATEVVLRVSDDGRGFNRDAIRKKAIERGLLKPDVALSDRDLFGFVLETGFSTAEAVTQLSGRGVGMDVVHNEIKQLGGSLAIDSERGHGTTFTIRLPFTLAVTQAILVRLGESTYAIPMSSVQGVVRMAREDLERRLADTDPSYIYAGDEFFIYDLAGLLNVPLAARSLDDTQLPLLMTRTGDQRAAVRIDAVIGSREVVVKSVGPQISSVPGIFGATIMGDGSVVMILDLAPLVRRSAALRARSAESQFDVAPDTPVLTSSPIEHRKPLVMVVDDSITMRKVTTRVLERNDLEVLTAKDGLDAVEKLQDKIPDVMLLDIEMPRMDGYELATYMKNDPRLKLVPIIMITSRTGEKHRQRAFEIGVERYLGKPYQEADLLRNVQETLRLARAEP